MGRHFSGGLGMRIAIFLIFWFFVPAVSGNAAVFPVVSVGDSISGEITLNLATPCSGIFCSPPLIEFNTNFGNVQFNIGGTTFANPIGFIRASEQPVAPFTQWFASGGDSNSIFDIELLGQQPFSSILPLPLSSYSTAQFSLSENNVVSPHPYGELFASANYNGDITSLTETSPGNFAFSGVITDYEASTFFADAVPEPSTWAMLLIGFVGLSFVSCARSRKTRAFAPA